MRIHYLQHVPFETPAMIAEWAQARGYHMSSTKLYEEGAERPSQENYDALVVMGGPMGVSDEISYPWLVDEKRFIRAAIDAKKHVLGVCLGAQLIAHVLGAKVAPHYCKEIGWFPVAVLDSAAGHPVLANVNMALNVLHWHGDRFEIPEGAQLLMRSQVCDHQAFIYQDRVLGLQFHLEMDAPAMERMFVECADELVASDTVQSAEAMRAHAAIPSAKHALYQLLDNWISA